MAGKFFSEDEDGNGSASSFYFVMGCFWGTTLCEGPILSFPAVFSSEIQDDLNITPASLSLMLTLPPLLSIPLQFLSPVLIDALGLDWAHVGTVLAEVLGMVLFALGCYFKSFPVVVLGSIIICSALRLVFVCKKVVLNNAMDPATYVAMNGWTNAVKGLGAAATSYILPMYTIQQVLPVLIGLSVLDFVFNTCLAKGGVQPLKKPARTICTIMEKQLSPKALRAMPWKYWLLAAAGALNGAVGGQVTLGPYILQKKGGLSQLKANQIMGGVSICALLVAPVCGKVFSNRERLRGPLFVFAATAHLMGQSLGITALSFSHWRFDIEAASWVIFGVGRTILSCGASGLVPETIKGKPELMATGSSLLSIFRDAVSSMVVQLSFVLFAHSFLEWRVLNIAVAAAIMADAIAIWLFAPLAPDQDGDSEEEEDDDSTSSSDSKGSLN